MSISNEGLLQLAKAIELSAPQRDRLRLQFGYACVQRVGHLLEDRRAIDAIEVCRQYLENACDRATLDVAARTAAAVASGHRGSSSIDGAAHAAVSATYAVAKALAGRALEAADYAAYASVYAYSAHAVTDPAAFAGERAWQLQKLEELSEFAG